MAFEKIMFKEIITDGKSEFMINNKFVDKETYDKVSLDESLYILPPLPKMNGSPENSNSPKPNNVTNINKYSFNDSEYESNSDNEECDCPQCQELLDIIYTIREMDDYEAKDLLTNYIDAIKTKTGLETSTEIYSQLGNGMIKVSAQLDVQLDNFMSQFDVVEEE